MSRKVNFSWLNWNSKYSATFSKWVKYFTSKCLREYNCFRDSIIIAMNFLSSKAPGSLLFKWKLINKISKLVQKFVMEVKMLRTVCCIHFDLNASIKKNQSKEHWYFKLAKVWFILNTMAYKTTHVQAWSWIGVYTL